MRPADVLTSFGEGLCQLASFGCKGGDQIAVGLDVEEFSMRATAIGPEVETLP